MSPIKIKQRAYDWLAWCDQLAKQTITNYITTSCQSLLSRYYYHTVLVRNVLFLFNYIMNLNSKQVINQFAHHKKVSDTWLFQKNLFTKQLLLKHYLKNKSVDYYCVNKLSRLY